ncbi:MAG: flagellar biosynthetic protein FliR [Gaiellaceae bacterium]
MTTITLPEIAGEQVLSFLLVVSRVGGLFVFAPIFSSNLIPRRAKAIAAGAIAIPITPVVAGGIEVPEAAYDTALLIGREMLVGLGFAFSIGVLIAAIQMGAGLIDTIVGFSFAALVDPITQVRSAVFGRLYAMFAVIVLVVAGGDHVMITGLVRSYDVVPIGAMPSFESLGALATDGFARVFLIGLEVAAPVLIALVLVTSGLGLVARTVPQANVFILGIPAQILVALATVAATIPFLARYVTSELEQSVFAGLRALGLG